MHSTSKVVYALIVTLLSAMSSGAQEKQIYPSDEYKYGVHDDDPLWVHEMYNEDADPGMVVSLYRSWRKLNPDVKNQHTQFYKRCIRNLSRTTAVYTDGRPDAAATRLADKAKINIAATSRMGSGWIPRGPFDFDIGAAGVSYAPGSAHVYTVEQSLSDPNTLYAGTATIGVWKTADKGLSWNHITADLMTNSVRALEIDPSSADICYFGSRGAVWKTTDGGATWSETGDAAFQADYHDVEDIVSLPGSPNTLLLSSNFGLYRTTDGGTNWSEVLSADIQEIEIHPANPLIVYAVSLNANRTLFWKSTDGGLTFVQKLNGWPVPLGGEEQRRTEIAVNPASVNQVTALATGEAAGGSGLYGIYISNDAGENWTFSCCGSGPGGIPTSANPNIMHWDTDGLTSGGQYYYDLALAVEPATGGDILTGGINIWRSSDGGASFVNNAHWTLGSAGARYVHADVHDIRFYGTDLWVASDGGIYYSNDGGYNFEKRVNGITGTDFWGFGAGFADGEIMLGGTYHNGTLLKDGSVYIDDWISMLGGDNYRGFVNFGDEDLVYHDGGKLKLPGDRTKALPSIPVSKKPNASYIIGESSDITFDPRSYRVFYTGNEGGLWRSEDDGSGFELVRDFGTGSVTSVEVARTNPDVIYVAYYPGWWDPKEIWKTTDAGVTWEDITPTSTELNGNTSAPYDLAVSSSDENELWLTRTQQSSSYNNLDGYKVFRSTDGGDTWINRTTSTLDGEYPTNILHQRSTDGMVYLGTRRGVFYRDETMTDWVAYTAGLPASTFSVRMIPYYREGKIRNGTNHSVWEADFAVASAPEAQIAVDKMKVSCLRDTVFFADHSVLLDDVATWSWSFPGGSPSTSTDRNPRVIYSSEGSYSVSLTVSDATGTSSQTIDDLITVVNECAPEAVPGLAMETLTDGDFATVPSLGLTTNEITFSAWIKPYGVQGEYTGIVMHSGIGAGLNFRPGMELAYHWPGGQWYWSSGLTVPVNSWSHVALVITPSSATVYLNGKGATHNISLDSVEFGNLLLGSYKGWSGRNYAGLIDEVCVWDRALSQDEIRELRHLTKVPSDDISLMAYWQFNRAEGEVTDRVGSKHATLGGNASRTISSGPFGGGISHRMDITGPGSYFFTDADAVIDFASGSGTPDGEVVITKINTDPDQWPDGTEPHADAYWIVNNYGVNTSFDAPSRLELRGYGEILPEETWFPEAFHLYTRGENKDGTSWTNSPVNSASDVLSGSAGHVIFEPGIGLTGSLQLAVQRDAVVSSGTSEPVRGLVRDLKIYPNPASERVRISWKEAVNCDAKIRISNPEGKIIYTRNLQSIPAAGSFNLTVTEFPIGKYALEMICTDGVVYLGSFVKMD